MWSARYLALVVAASPSLTWAGIDLTTTLTLNNVSAAANTNQQFPGSKTRQNQQWLSTRGQLGPVQLQLTYANSQISGQPDQGDLVVEELVLDHNSGDWDFSLGVKRLDWGVGYGYRPLSLFEHTDRLSLVTPLNPGAALVSASRYGATDAWTVLCAAESENALENSFRSDLRCVARAFALVGDWDLQGLVSNRSDTGLSLGASFSTVVGDSTEFHGSTYLSERKVAAEGLPPDENDGGSTVEVLLGVTHTTESNLTLIGEVWRDETLRTSIGEPVDYVMGRATYVNDTIEPSITALHTPEDGGLALTLGATSSWANGAELNYGVREYVGPNDAFYTKLPDKRQFYVEFSAAF